MAIDPTLSHQLPALTVALSQAFRVTLDALADMYERKDGPWVDELREAAIQNDPPLAPAAVEEVDALFANWRGELKPRSANS